MSKNKFSWFLKKSTINHLLSPKRAKKTETWRSNKTKRKFKRNFRENEVRYTTYSNYIKSEINKIGEYKISINLHSDVEAKVLIKVVKLIPNNFSTGYKKSV